MERGSKQVTGKQKKTSEKRGTIRKPKKNPDRGKGKKSKSWVQTASQGAEFRY